MPWWRAEGMCEYPPLGDAMRAAWIKEIDTYISRRKNTVVGYIATFPILKLCLDTERRPGSRTPNWWWEQEGLLL